MFGKKTQTLTGSKDMGTVIGNGIVLENVRLKGLGTVCVDGAIIGEIQLEGHLIIGESGKVVGDVHTGSAVFYGTYEGNLTVDGTLHIAKGAHVDGNIRSDKLIIDEGAGFYGTCNMEMSKSDVREGILLAKTSGNDERAALTSSII